MSKDIDVKVKTSASKSKYRVLFDNNKIINMMQLIIKIILVRLLKYKLSSSLTFRLG